MFRICQTVISLEKGCKGYLFRRPNWIKNCEIIFAMGAYFGGRIFLRTLFMRVYTKIPYVFISTSYKGLRIRIFQHMAPLNKVSSSAINIFVISELCQNYVCLVKLLVSLSFIFYHYSQKEPSVVFIASPSTIVFSDYQVGKVYEMTLDLKNVSAASRQLRIIPPKTQYFSVGLGKCKLLWSKDRNDLSCDTLELW